MKTICILPFRKVFWEEICNPRAGIWFGDRHRF